jgi:hypothetical protein
MAALDLSCPGASQPDVYRARVKAGNLPIRSEGDRLHCASTRAASARSTNRSQEAERRGHADGDASPCTSRAGS